MVRRRPKKLTQNKYRILYYPNQKKYTIYSVLKPEMTPRENKAICFGEPFYIVTIDAFDEAQALATALYQLKEIKEKCEQSDSITISQLE